MGFSKNTLLDPYDDLKRQQTSRRAPATANPREKHHLPSVKFMLAAGAYPWRPSTSHT